MMDEKIKVTANTDNDLLFRDNLDIKKKKSDNDNINESTDSSEKIEYITE